ncbi:MAG: hypothetical protein F6K11_19310 [Leptolyngbya sp. SIO3F4]|nr:hypothetical protein [Leptolyngbya sp. SIO3F4]
MNTCANWFRRIVLVGVVVNLVLSIPTLIVPEIMLSLFNLPLAVPVIWVQFSANLLILLSLFYIPAALDPFRYQASAWLAVFSRVAGVIFFLTQAKIYLLFGMLDLSFAIPEGLLLILAYRANATELQETGV